MFEAVFQAASPAPLPAPDARMRPIVADVAGKVSHVKVVRPTGVDKGAQGAQAPQSPGKKNFSVKTVGLSSLPPAKSGRACYDNPTARGCFYQMSNMYMYTCIACLIEIRKFCSKNLVHKGVNFEAQNALKLTYEHL